jgi:hypothetical protein|tara:strand:+ start:2027 stop:2251 length:225 start_codon:yes stop_codon:yes gene_type:complete
MIDFNSVDDSDLLSSQETDLLELEPEMKLAAEDVRTLLIVAKNILVELRLRNIDANNIVALVDLLYKRSEANAK